MKKMRNSNLFMKYHCSVNAFAEVVRKKMNDKYGITSAEFAVLSVGYMMQHKSGFFNRKFVRKVRQIDHTVVYRLIKSLQKKGFIHKTGMIKNAQMWQLTKLGMEVIVYYTKVYMEIIDKFEEDYWKLNAY